MSQTDPHKEVRRLRRTTPLRDYPWKTVATSTAGIGAGAGLGYLASGLLTRAALRGSLGQRLSRMTPAQRKALWTGVGGLAATTGLAAKGLSSMAAQARVAEEMAYREALRRQQAGEKSAAAVTEVYETYALAWEQL